jgi:CheY-like chemotaxis protein
MLRLTEPLRREEASPLTLILLVQDDQENAQLFAHILSQEVACYVIWATNGLAALRFTQHVRPQLFLLDYSLPDMNGIQLYDRLHARRDLEAVPALIMGASLEAARDDIQQRGLLAVEKPFDLDESLSYIASTIASSPCMPPGLF